MKARALTSGVDSLHGLVVLTEGTLLGLVDHGQHTGDVLANNLDLGQLGCSATGDLSQHDKTSA